MIEFTFRPIDRWPQELTKSRRYAHFRVGYSDTLKLLSYELEKIGARRVFLQADVMESEIRLNGQLRADAKPRSPRVIVSAETRFGPVMLPCDSFTDWKDNLRAIALSLEALRAVDRYGVTKRGEQYRGLKQLSAGTGPINSQEAAAFIAKFCDSTETALLRGSLLLSQPSFEKCYRYVTTKLHPDVAGESTRADWDKLQAAAAIIRDHFARSK